MGSVHDAFTLPATLPWSNWLPVSGTCYVWRMMRGGSLTTHFEPLHKLRAHAGDVTAAFVYSPNPIFINNKNFYTLIQATIWLRCVAAALPCWDLVYSPNMPVHHPITIHQQLHFLVQELHGGMRLYCARCT